ncbi:UDP-N-acetylmuramoyl-L-alanyl-D-glutamate--2,6-diaminopimelate ligase [Luteimicrobium xylanilyticum]|uniref:UDP-N-acetylmuramyl-tripeptide synthetase n=1 Tax=Luteimicrobium xylanilyticum TaxID=1133546 RepID=A0A5P9Q971_9MICO|nr:UDP-N-acetylmuramoyl-L-alanyl-D-glutamate--2,6-diaminopimelate ligase [Luteimicrobium xylanilyticum]
MTVQAGPVATRPHDRFLPVTSPAPRLRPRTSARLTLERLIEGMAAVDGTAGPGGATATGDVVVTGVGADNRTVAPGDLFVALPGAHVHGARFVADAVAAGAVAVVTDDAGARLLADRGATPAVPVVVVPDPRAALGVLAARAYGEPTARLATFAVTGTNGKTTTTYALDAVLAALGRTTGLVGTVEIRSAGRVVPSALTTPEAADLQAILATMVDDGVDSLAMEVSSHALALHRVDPVVYDVAGFTNLSQDHLDFHGTLDAYFDAKATLFTPTHARRGVVVVPADGPGRAWALRLLDRATVPVVPLRLPGAQAPGDGWTVEDVADAPDGQHLVLVHDDGRRLAARTTLPGAFNVANVALALAMVVESGVGTDVLADAVERAGGVAPTVPGRMETVSDGVGPRVVVDFAHNPDALALALDALRPTTTGRLVVVFGATGERDTGKRPTMGRVAVERADVVVVTDDDPHGEDPAPIRAEVLDGARGARDAQARVTLVEVAPRAAAIRQAVLGAADEDTVLVAGRGHEIWQEIDGVNHPLDDRVEARAALAARKAETRPVGGDAAPTGEQDA